MKTLVTFLFLSLFLVGLASVPLCAQGAFNSKKKKNTTVNTSSLHAVRVKGSSFNTNKQGRILSPLFSQASSIKSLPEQPKQRVIYRGETGLPAFITSIRESSGARQGLNKDIQTACYNYLNELKPLLQLEKPNEDFIIQHIKVDQYNKKHVRLAQQYKGVPVYGGEVIVHLNEFGEGETFNGTYFNIKENINPAPSISEQLAIEKVDMYLSKGKAMRALTSLEKKLVQHEQPKATLCVYQDRGLIKTFVLAYHIVSCPSIHQRWEYFINATTGAVIHSFESTCFADGPRTAVTNDLNGVSRTVNTYQKGSTFFMLDISRAMYKTVGSSLPDDPIGGILTIDMNNTFGNNQTIQHSTSGNNAWGTSTQVKSVTAHFNAGIAYEYFRTKHGRNSIDGNGGTIISILNVPDEDGNALDNAYWNGKAMFYGNGDVGFKPLAGAMDVAGHELTHGVVQNTANLEYQGESGAINESMADIFGSMMDPEDWLIGEDIVKTNAFPSGALRSLSDPHNGGTNLASPGFQPKHVSEAYTGTQDNGGVHINSGIPNHAFYKYAEEITRSKAAAVFYKALDDYLTKSSRFIDLRLAVIQAASDLYGASSNEVIQAGIAFDAVGIGAGQGGDYTETLPVNPGTEFLMIYNTDLSNANTLYRISLDGLTETPLSKTEFNSRPSITDDGESVVFVAADNTIHVINLEGSSPAEIVLQDQQIWSNVVVSKGGTKIAAVTTSKEPIIYVYDFASEVWTEFTLYNPTYSEDVISAGPVYADALEWDYTGEFLVYDCFNSLANSDGADIEYWDVNFIRVWNNDTNSFGDGTISKLFASLPDGVSVGNPSFAKNSPGIIAFDYFDEDAEEYAILGCNVETSEVNTITSNNTLGWPSYDRGDAHIAFTSLDDNSQYQTNNIILNSDKISASVEANGLYEKSKWPVYFATGQREIGDKIITQVVDELDHVVSMHCYPNPFHDEVSLTIGKPLLKSSIEIINIMGQKVYETMTTGFNESLNLNLSNLKAGYYIVRIKTNKEVGSCRIVKR